jgi:hypothetical protein
MNQGNFPILHFDVEFDERAAFEAEQRGLCDCVVAELEDGRRYRVSFFTPARLGVELGLLERNKEPCIGEPGLIVISQVTAENMTRAVKFLHDQRFFDRLMPI